MSARYGLPEGWSWATPGAIALREDVSSNAVRRWCREGTIVAWRRKGSGFRKGGRWRVLRGPTGMAVCPPGPTWLPDVLRELGVTPSAAPPAQVPGNASVASVLASRGAIGLQPAG